MVEYDPEYPGLWLYWWLGAECMQWLADCGHQTYRVWLDDDVVGSAELVRGKGWFAQGRNASGVFRLSPYERADRTVGYLVVLNNRVRCVLSEDFAIAAAGQFRMERKGTNYFHLVAGYRPPTTQLTPLHAKDVRVNLTMLSRMRQRLGEHGLWFTLGQQILGRAYQSPNGTVAVESFGHNGLYTLVKRPAPSSVPESQSWAHLERVGWTVMVDNRIVDCWFVNGSHSAVMPIDRTVPLH